MLSEIERIDKKNSRLVSKLRRRYCACDPIHFATPAFRSIVLRALKGLRRDPGNLYCHIEPVLKEVVRCTALSAGVGSESTAPPTDTRLTLESELVIEQTLFLEPRLSPEDCTSKSDSHDVIENINGEKNVRTQISSEQNEHSSKERDDINNELSCKDTNGVDAHDVVNTSILNEESDNIIPGESEVEVRYKEKENGEISKQIENEKELIKDTPNAEEEITKESAREEVPTKVTIKEIGELTKETENKDYEITKVTTKVDEEITKEDKETTKELINEDKETIKDIATDEDISKEAKKENKEISKDTEKEVEEISKETPKEDEEITKEDKETTKDITKEVEVTTKDIAIDEDISKEAKKENKDISKDTEKEVEGISKEAKKENKEISKDTEKEVEEIFKETTKEDEDKETIKDKETTKYIATEEEISKEAVKENKEMSKDTEKEVEDISKETPKEDEEITKETPKEYSEMIKWPDMYYKVFKEDEDEELINETDEIGPNKETTDLLKQNQLEIDHSPTPTNTSLTLKEGDFIRHVIDISDDSDQEEEEEEQSSKRKESAALAPIITRPPSLHPPTKRVQPKYIGKASTSASYQPLRLAPLHTSRPSPRSISRSSQFADIENGDYGEKTLYRITRLENSLMKISKIIKVYDEKELSFNDMDNEDSTYLQAEGAKRRYVMLWNKLCQVANRTQSTGRSTERKAVFKETRYDFLNKEIEKFLNVKRRFPDRSDIEGVVTASLKENNVNMSKTDRGGLIDNIFLTVGNNLQNRRIKDLKIPSSDLINKERINNDPARTNNELRRQLKQNAVISHKNMQSIFDRFSSRQSHSENNGLEVVTSEDEESDDYELPDCRVSDDEGLESDSSSDSLIVQDFSPDHSKKRKNQSNDQQATKKLRNIPSPPPSSPNLPSQGVSDVNGVTKADVTSSSSSVSTEPTPTLLSTRTSTPTSSSIPTADTQAVISIASISSPPTTTTTINTTISPTPTPTPVTTTATISPCTSTTTTSTSFINTSTASTSTTTTVTIPATTITTSTVTPISSSTATTTATTTATPIYPSWYTDKSPSVGNIPHPNGVMIKRSENKEFKMTEENMKDTNKRSSLLNTINMEYTNFIKKSKIDLLNGTLDLKPSSAQLSTINAEYSDAVIMIDSD